MPLFASRAARRRLRLQTAWFGAGGRLEVEEIGRARALATAAREAGEEAVGAAALVALDRLVAAFEEVTQAYLERVGADVFERALELLGRRLGPGRVSDLLLRFADEFELRRAGAEAGGPAAAPGEAALLLRELLLFWVLDGNPAAAPIAAALHDTRLRSEPLYLPAIALLREFFEGEPGLEEGGPGLVECLLEPSRSAPGSLAEQLRFLYRRWRHLLRRLEERLLRGIDLLEEEESPRFAPGPGPVELPSFEGEWTERRSFSPDREWMPRLVLLAKNAYVWLDQLSRQYGKALHTLDQIPDEVLDLLAARGFTGLWLIGVWERSPASARIKRLCGNPEAIGSAYSLRRYRIADQLGGDQALEKLGRRAAERGIRLAADMVPNHMGIDSDWLLEHPDWFLGLDECPYPNYTFDGPDLSPDPRVGIFLEDHYYDRSDAAVVFKRLDRETGRVRYIYHGNDGTSTPWNDTAQLDFLRPEVREAVAGVILDVARRFPVIRFDAAMTLTRRHFQRLWYPPPGGGGAIPTRAENGLTQEEFQAAMPAEFWREVVDRVATDAPDTLLLAEAFWLMEGYFVRSLGMHRVYNSAFMNMLRDGDTGKYRRLIQETLEFDPEILKRYVNFMSNPDERTAVDQFGTDDRFFGVSAVLATMPGLPMFAHGQFEGLREKYGMEYQRAYWNETPDHGLVARNEREISPLLRQRGRYAGVEAFRLFDFMVDGGVDENVLAFSNGFGQELSLTVFNNRYAEARGRLDRSAPFRQDGESEQRTSSRFAELLDLDTEEGFVTFRDRISGDQYLASAGDLRSRGLELSLRAFEYRVLQEFRHRPDDGRGSLARLHQRLAGGGTPSLEEALRGLAREPLHDALRAVLAPSVVSELLSGAPGELSRLADDQALETLRGGLEEWVRAAAGWAESEAAEVSSAEPLLALVTLPALTLQLGASRQPATRQAGRRLERALERQPAILAGLYGWLALREAAGRLPEVEELSQPFESLGLATPLAQALRAAGAEDAVAERMAQGLAAAWRLEWGVGQPRRAPGARQLLQALLGDSAGRRVLGAHRSEDQEWVAREGVELVADLVLVLEAMAGSAGAAGSAAGLVGEVTRWGRLAVRLETEAESAGYRVDRLLAALSETGSEPERSGPGAG